MATELDRVEKDRGQVEVLATVRDLKLRVIWKELPEEGEEVLAEDSEEVSDVAEDLLEDIGQ